MQITARSDRDLTPEIITQKVSDASGSKYSSDNGPAVSSGSLPPVSAKPAFMPTRSSGGSAGFNPLAGSNIRANLSGDAGVDEDGWGLDAPPVTRTQLEKVPSAYQRTKVDMRELSSQKQRPSQFNGAQDIVNRSDVVKGGYQPIGKVDIAALRSQSQTSNSAQDDRPTATKGSYEPVGKVDITAIRARAQRPSEGNTSPTSRLSPAATGTSTRINDNDVPKPIADRSTSLSVSERLTSLPKPKVANRFGLNAPSPTGTKAPSPAPYGLNSKLSPGKPPVGASRTFADEGGKTPAQIWAEKKARQQASGGLNEQPGSASIGPISPITNQTSGGGEWKSGYAGKSWAPVQTTKTGQSASSLGQQRTGDDQTQQEASMESSIGRIGAIRDKFKDAPPMGAAAIGSERSAPSPPPLNTSSNPHSIRGVPIPGIPSRPTQYTQDEYKGPSMPTPPPQPPRSPTPPTPISEESSSPIRVAMPIARGEAIEIESAHEEQFSPPPVMPLRSLAQTIPHEDELTEEFSSHNASHVVSETVATTSADQDASIKADTSTHESGKHAIVQYDYEKAEDNELELKEGEYVTNIKMVDEDWWMGQNPRGETGLFPSNYVELLSEDGNVGNTAVTVQEPEPAPSAGPVGGHHDIHGAVATALYDYEAAEDNELSFPEGSKITGVVRTMGIV